MAFPTLPLDEIQGLLASGYGAQQAMCCMQLKILDPTKAKNWLSALMDRISFCDDRRSESKLNVAFTFSGLESLVKSDDLHGFSREFCEGIVTPHRQRVLGDLPNSSSDPQKWRWGGPNNKAIDLALMAYELDADALSQQLNSLLGQFEGVELVAELNCISLRDSKEHFGFRDGISQPWVPQLHKPGFSRDRVNAGEFLLGHVDNARTLEPVPAIARNGSYLVIRQIEQRVEEFWQSMQGDSYSEKIRQAAIRVGRWPDGTPVTLSPLGPDPSQPDNDFAYAQTDRNGTRCPIGSHLRRSNPRDVLLSDPKLSQESVNRHRILRRGRVFGMPAPPSVYPEGIVVEAESGFNCADEGRGILFMCLNASLARQFEFVQQNWLNDPKFMNLSNETDPIASTVSWSGPGECPTFTAPAQPLRTRTIETEKFIFTVGGGYFFLPSRSALKHLASS